MKSIKNQWEYNVAVKLIIFLSVLTILIIGKDLLIPLMIAVFLWILMCCPNTDSKALDRAY